MKKAIATLCFVSATLALSACGTTGSSSSTDAPYSQERTATYTQDGAVEHAPVMPAEQVFHKSQAK